MCKKCAFENPNQGNRRVFGIAREELTCDLCEGKIEREAIACCISFTDGFAGPYEAWERKFIRTVV